MSINPSDKKKYSERDVAEIITDLFGDSCACNFNGISDWLPEVCDFRATSCPDPPEETTRCWGQYLKHLGEKQKETQ